LVSFVAGEQVFQVLVDAQVDGAEPEVVDADEAPEC